MIISTALEDILNTEVKNVNTTNNYQIWDKVIYCGSRDSELPTKAIVVWVTKTWVKIIILRRYLYLLWRLKRSKKLNFEEEIKTVIKQTLFSRVIKVNEF